MRGRLRAAFGEGAPVDEHGEHEREGPEPEEPGEEGEGGDAGLEEGAGVNEVFDEIGVYLGGVGHGRLFGRMVCKVLTAMPAGRYKAGMPRSVPIQSAGAEARVVAIFSGANFTKTAF